MRILFLDCFSGISGDMTVGALCDLGVKPSALEWELSKIDIGAFHMHFERARRKQIEGVRFTIHEGHIHREENAQDERRDHADHSHDGDGHDREEHGGHVHAHAEDSGCVEHALHHHHHAAHSDEDDTHHHHPQADKHSHAHEHGDEHQHQHPAHDQPPASHGRTHRQIGALIEQSDCSPFVKTHALGIFQRIAEAEGKIHGMSPDAVHFHEVGALDSIADIICVCAALETLAVDKVFVSPLHDGRGWIDCAHGRFPLPAPATLEILRGIPLAQIDEPHELITPTGAAIVAEFAESFGAMPRMRVEKIGYGVGARDLESRPNVLRAVLGELALE